MKLRYLFITFLCFFSYTHATNIQKDSLLTPQIHHKETLLKTPFWYAYSNGATSVEIDVFLKDGELYTTHNSKNRNTFDEAYLSPLEKTLYSLKNKPHTFYFLINIYSENQKTLNTIVSQIKKHPSLLHSQKIHFVILENLPKIKDLNNYPNFISFGTNNINSNLLNHSKVSLAVLDFKKITTWNGKGRLTQPDKDKITTIVSILKKKKKKILLSNTPNSKTAWRALTNLNVDFLSTPTIYECKKFLESLSSRQFKSPFYSSVYQPKNIKWKNKNPKNIILLIGDGNGLSHISATLYANGGQTTLSQLKNIGFIKTYSADDFTTDSAAAGTAIATGKKTNNRAIGTDIYGGKIENITEILNKKGFQTGVITTDKITGATPSSFYAHQIDRSSTALIAKDLENSKLSIFIGGGKKHFKDIPLSKQFTLLNSLDEISTSTSNNIGYFLADENPVSALKGRKGILALATKKTFDYFNLHKNPFFLMIEGAKIDSYAHENDIAGIVSEGIDFDMAITEAIKFADKNKETLVIITADHETAGLSIPNGSIKNRMVEADFTTFDHTGTLVPIFSYGPKSELFTGFYENNEIFKKIMKLLE